MKEKLYTIPLMDAFNENSECPFCAVARNLERDALDYTLGNGSSYMESDVREATDSLGFCNDHFHKMYTYGNTLGNALILKTHLHKLNSDLKKSFQNFTPMKKKGSSSLLSSLEKLENTCFICDYINRSYSRYFDTFFYLLRTNPDFFPIVQNCKGFCLHHLKELLSIAPSQLNDKEQMKYLPTVLEVSKNGLLRLEEDVSWLVDKFDYRNKDADWKNSKDALPRGIQKVVGGFPSDGPYTAKR